MIATIALLVMLVVGGVLLFELGERRERRVELASELQVPGSAQIRAAYDRAFRTRTWPVPAAATADMRHRQKQRAIESDVRAA